MRAVVIASIAAAAYAAGGLDARGAEESQVTVAVVRGDGILIPVATRTGDRWRNGWPEPRKRVSVPVRTEDLPKRWWGAPGPSAIWHAWFVDGRTARTTIERPAWYASYCLRGIGLQTDLRAQGPLPPPTESPYPKLGLAATTPLPFQPVESLDDSHAIRLPLVTALARPVTDAEARIYLQLHTGDAFASPFDPAAGDGRAWTFLPKSPHALPGRLRVQRVFRVPVGERRFLYYFEAERRYPEDRAAAEQPRRCEGLTFVTGWFISEAAAVPDTLPVHVELASCNYDGVTMMLPLGYLSTEGGALLIAQFTSWNRETYALVRADRRRVEPEVILQTAGGRCN